MAPDGSISTVAASSTLNLQDMAGLALDSQGNLYVSDYAGNRIFKISSDDSVQTIAGNGTAGFSGDGGPAISAQPNGPYGITVDGAGNVYVAGNQRIRKISQDGTIATVASGLNTPYWLSLDASGSVIATDTNASKIFKLTSAGLTTIAGGGACCSGGDNGPAFKAQLHIGVTWGGSLSTDAQGELYIADTSNLRIRKVTADGIMHTVAGNGVSNEDTGDGGSAVAAQINYPYSVAADNEGNFYIGDGLLRKVSASGIISTLADPNGTPLKALHGLVVDNTGKVRDPGWYSAADSSGNLYMADFQNYVVWKITPEGTSTIVAGNGTPGFSGDAGPATNAQLNTPTAIAVDAIGDLYIADCFNHRIRIVTPDGIISTIAGNGSQGYSGDGGDAVNAQFGLISGMAVDKTGNLYLADQTYNVIRLVQWLPN
jgi:hypothetical protein